MNFMTPLIKPAKNTEQRIFKLALFVILPIIAVVTASAFQGIRANKANAAINLIKAQSENANKRLAMFLDPLSRDVAYLQVLANKKKLTPDKPSEIREFLTSFSKLYLQNVREVLFWDGSTASIFSIDQNGCTGPEESSDSFYSTTFEDTLNQPDLTKINWLPGRKEPFLFAAAVFMNSKSGKPNIIALHIDTTEVFAGLEKYFPGHLFLVPDRSGQLPNQFILTESGKPGVTETNDPVILTAFTQWKNNPSVETFPLIYNTKTWWVSIRSLQLKDRQLYSGLILPESELLGNVYKERRLIAFVSLVSFAIVMIAIIFLWRRYRQDIIQSTLPPVLNKMDDDTLIKTIASGEGDRLEFKSTLRWNLRTNKPDKAMEIACLKTVAAFLNSDGGTLLVGVEDDGTILGIEADQFPNEDKFLLHFNNLINHHLGLENTDSFSFDIRRLESGNIMVVDCQPSPVPVYLTHDSKEEFYVRVGPGTRPLTTRDALEYIRNHF